ncbi:MAG: exodeoxyribonuclease VII large subunit [Myxococcota bacterium]|nr:exodeoxyribonuclease VII large subunit [Myxococcota bacterium]
MAKPPDSKPPQPIRPHTNTPPKLSLPELGRRINQLLRQQIGQVILPAELSSVKFYPSGNVFLDLLDADEEGAKGDRSQLARRASQQRAQLKGVAAARHHGNMVKPEQGQRCELLGIPELYIPTGQLQLSIQGSRLLGVGAQEAALKALEAKLKSEGYFDRPKRRLPLLPKVVGVVTSARGEAIKDIRSTILRRNDRVELVLSEAKVQGFQAAQSLFDAFHKLSKNPRVEVIIIGRGGGGRQERMAFNDERLALAVAHSRVPTVSAVGHEGNHCILDKIADHRASTPSGAAEIVVPVRANLERELLQLYRGLLQLRARHLDRAEGQLRLLQTRLFERRGTSRWEQRLSFSTRALEALAERRLQAARDRLRDLEVRLHRHDPLRRHEALKAKLTGLTDRLVGAPAVILRERAQRLEVLDRALHALSPLAILNRGYSLARHDGHLLKNAAEVSVGDHLELVLAEGRLRVRVEEVIAPEHTQPEGAKTDS